MIAGFLVESIQGYGGVIPVPEGYFPATFARAREAGGLCIVDEVQTGFARLGVNGGVIMYRGGGAKCTTVLRGSLSP